MAQYVQNTGIQRVLLCSVGERFVTIRLHMVCDVEYWGRWGADDELGTSTFRSFCR
jgi:hypothetical protein